MARDEWLGGDELRAANDYGVKVLSWFVDGGDGGIDRAVARRVVRIED